MSRDARVLAAGLLLVGFGTNLSTPLLVSYRARLGLGDSSTMAIFAVYVVGIFSSLLLAGPISDRLGRRTVCAPLLCNVPSTLAASGCWVRHVCGWRWR